ncbi:MFS transporter [Acrocarpospora sp. B8E8]|uniref:MFS transporter n=1 Tax=Acrocarpospora sp. B8E8 TaxID=3153572 RepID=UPI00325CD536
MRRGGAPRFATPAFWLIFVSSALSNVAYSTTAPVLPRYVVEVLGGGPALVGSLVGLSPIASLVVQPFAGVLADRYGYRVVSVASGLLGSAGVLLLLVSATVPGVAAGRVLFGAGGSVIATALMAWVLAIVAPERRGQALGVFGLGVWIGLALGPVVGENTFHLAGFGAVWLVCGALQLGSVVAALVVRHRADGFPPEETTVVTGENLAGGAAGPTDGAPSAPSAPGWRVAVRSVTRAGVVAGLVWATEGVLLTYLVLHLESRGVRPDGVFGGASVFTVFAASVVLARLAVGVLPDRIGARRSAVLALSCVAAGLLVVAAAGSFAMAAAGAVVLGAGFAPLFPSLTMIATERLPPSLRATGLGFFNAYIAVGLAGGSFLGGVLSGWWGEWSAFVAAAALAVAGLGVLAAEPGHGLRARPPAA